MFMKAQVMRGNLLSCEPWVYARRTSFQRTTCGVPRDHYLHDRLSKFEANRAQEYYVTAPSARQLTTSNCGMDYDPVRIPAEIIP